MTNTTSLDSFNAAIFSARNAVLHLRLMSQTDSVDVTLADIKRAKAQDAALSVVLKALETAEQAMRAVPNIDALNEAAAAESAAD